MNGAGCGAIVKTCEAVGLTVLSVWQGGPHGDFGVIVAVPGYFGHAEPLVERLGAVVYGEHVQDQVLAFLGGLVDECTDQAGADAVPLMIGVDFDASEVDLAGTVFDVEHADACPAGCNDLPA